jgi:hypothetical protein
MTCGTPGDCIVRKIIYGFQFVPGNAMIVGYHQKLSIDTEVTDR